MTTGHTADVQCDNDTRLRREWCRTVRRWLQAACTDFYRLLWELESDYSNCTQHLIVRFACRPVIMEEPAKCTAHVTIFIPARTGGGGGVTHNLRSCLLPRLGLGSACNLLRGQYSIWHIDRKWLLWAVWAWKRPLILLQLWKRKTRSHARLQRVQSARLSGMNKQILSDGKKMRRIQTSWHAGGSHKAWVNRKVFSYKWHGASPPPQPQFIHSEQCQPLSFRWSTTCGH